MLTLFTASSCSGIFGLDDHLIGKSAPYTRINLLNGSYQSLSVYRGKTLIIAFWSTSCPFSRSALEDFNDFAKKHINRKDLVFLAINIDGPNDLETLENYIRENNLNYIRHAYSGNGVSDEAYLAFQFDSIPAMVVVDPKGTVKAIGRDIDIAEDFLAPTS